MIEKQREGRDTKEREIDNAVSERFRSVVGGEK